MKWEKITIKIIEKLLGLFGLGTITYIIWNCMLYGGNDWELLISFNKIGEGSFEIIMITTFLILYIISLVYIIIKFIYKYIKEKKRNYKEKEIFNWSEIVNKSIKKYKQI